MGILARALTGAAEGLKPMAMQKLSDDSLRERDARLNELQKNRTVEERAYQERLTAESKVREDKLLTEKQAYDSKEKQKDRDLRRELADKRGSGGAVSSEMQSAKVIAKQYNISEGEALEYNKLSKMAGDFAKTAAASDAKNEFAKEGTTKNASEYHAIFMETLGANRIIGKSADVPKPTTSNAPQRAIEKYNTVKSNPNLYDESIEEIEAEFKRRGWAIPE